MTLQTWQTYLEENKVDLEVIERNVKALRPIIDGSVNHNTYPEYYALVAPTLEEAKDVLEAVAGGDMFDFSDTEADYADVYAAYQDMHSMWLLLRPFAQGQRIDTCDAGLAEQIQELAEGFLAEEDAGGTGDGTG